MLKIIQREVVRTAYVANRAKVYFDRMKFPKGEASGVDMTKGYSQF